MAALVVASLIAMSCSGESEVTAVRADPIDAATTVDLPAVEPGSADSEPGDDGSATPETDESGPAMPALPTTVPRTGPQTTEPEQGESPTSPADPDGVGDSLFPALGNPGIDVEHYDVDLTYDPDRDTIAGSVTLSLAITEDRDEFTLDAAGPEVDEVTIDGSSVDFEMEDRELRITPSASLVKGDEHVVVVTYHAAPDAGSSTSGLPNGWFNTDAGSYVLNEPDGARTWLPSNDHPSDKATWTFAITVPTGMTAVANGALVSTEPGPEGDTWTWEEAQPMATYLVQLLTGDYELIEGTGPDGLPLLSVVLTEDVKRMQPFVDSIDDQIDFFDDYFGPYPLDSYGIAMSDSFSGLAMETQSRSLFSRDDFISGELGYWEELLLSHELTHQWFGDAVSPARWKDIWLNEGFATYGEWMWLDHVGQQPLEAAADGALANRYPGRPVADPSVDDLFGDNSYNGGATVLHALRRTVGDDVFFEILQRWVTEHAGESETSEDFVEFASKVAGTGLADFFDEWLYSGDPPTKFPT